MTNKLAKVVWLLINLVQSEFCFLLSLDPLWSHVQLIVNCFSHNDDLDVAGFDAILNNLVAQKSSIVFVEPNGYNHSYLDSKNLESCDSNSKYGDYRANYEPTVIGCCSDEVDSAQTGHSNNVSNTIIALSGKQLFFLQNIKPKCERLQVMIQM